MKRQRRMVAFLILAAVVCLLPAYAQAYSTQFTMYDGTGGSLVFDIDFGNITDPNNIIADYSLKYNSYSPSAGIVMDGAVNGFYSMKTSGTTMILDVNMNGSLVMILNGETHSITYNYVTVTMTQTNLGYTYKATGSVVVDGQTFNAEGNGELLFNLLY